MEGVRAIYAGWGGDGRAIARRLACCALPYFTRRRLPGRVGESRSVRTRPGCNQRASTVQINPRKTKQNQGKKLGFPWIPLANSGLFNALRGIQIKNLRCAKLACQVARKPLCACSLPLLPTAVARVAASIRRLGKLSHRSWIWERNCTKKFDRPIAELALASSHITNVMRFPSD
jgi:hypothetical protein